MSRLFLPRTQIKFLLTRFSMSVKPQSRRSLSHPLHQEGPARKKRRLSQSESSPDDSEDSSSSEQDATDPSRGREDFVRSDPEDFIDWETHSSDFIVEDRLGSFGRRPKPSNSQTISPSIPDRIESFSSLGISAPIQSALKSMSIRLPTEVQVACIPPLLLGKYLFFLKVPGIELATKQAEIVSAMPKLVQEKQLHLHCQYLKNSQSTLTVYLPWC